jgi:hypothetical protein
MWPSGQLSYETCLQILDELAHDVVWQGPEDSIPPSGPDSSLLQITYDHVDLDTRENVQRMIGELLREYPDYSGMVRELLSCQLTP